MDLVTFYALYAIGSAPSQVSRPLRFPSMKACEWFSGRARERTTADFKLFDTACVADGTKGPEWAVEPPIVGVPLMPDAMKR